VVHAYILVQTEVGKAAAVAAEIAGIPGVTTAEDVTGPYDVIVRAEADNVDLLGQLVVSRVQNVEGITRTLTCPVVNLEPVVDWTPCRTRLACRRRTSTRAAR
jgi:DNA-binding Lrp family transcriptional regulator